MRSSFSHGFKNISQKIFLLIGTYDWYILNQLKSTLTQKYQIQVAFLLGREGNDQMGGANNWREYKFQICNAFYYVKTI